ncbi:MAG TPA: type II secretion system F family protein [Bryobacteraceae bacterium]|nr:type II secretion system F family protein [Bryobacteraceae bacterium]
MAEWVLKYADARGEIHQQTASAGSEQEIRERYSQQGFLIYSVRPRRTGIATGGGILGRSRKLNLERFLIFNQQFVTLIRAGLPILKALDLLADRLTDAHLGQHVKAVRDEVKNGTLLSEAFRRQGVFPKIYTTSVLAGEKSGGLVEVLERYVSYQKLALAVRKKVLVSLLYPTLLIGAAIVLIVFLVVFVVPNFAELYKSVSAQLPGITQFLISVGTTARSYVLFGAAALVVAGLLLRFWARTEGGRDTLDKVKMRLPLFGDMWLKYQVAQFARVLSTLLSGGIPLVQGLETAGDSLGTALLGKALEKAGKMVREGQTLSSSLTATGIFPPLAIDMIEVGESTGALPAMLSSVAEFYEDDVNTKMTASLSLIEPVIMIFMGAFVAFVLVALYLPIFSLADNI